MFPHDGVVPGLDDDAPVRELVATYYDTADVRLARWGATVRFCDGDGWTVTLPTALESPLAPRAEIPFPGAAGGVPHDAAALVSSLTRGAPLAPVATAADAAPHLDVLRAAGGSGAAPVPNVVRALGGTATAPPDVEVPELVSSPTVREVIRHSLSGPARSLLLVLPSVRLDDDVEDVHDARVAIRRMRSRLRTFRPFVDGRWATDLTDGLGDLGRVLGEVRDLDVLTGMVTATPIDGEGLTELLGAVETERHGALSRALDFLDDPSCAALLDRVVDAANDPALAPQADDPARPVLSGLVARPWRRLRRAVRRLPDPTPDDALHQIRIRAKRCRYAAEAVQPVVGREGRRLARRLTEVQDALGHLNDAAVVTARLEGIAPLLTRRGAFAAGAVTGVLVDRTSHHRTAWREPWRKAEEAARWLA